MDRLTNAIRGYAWGSHTAIARLQNRPFPSRRPEAELWLGAHAGDSSRIVRDGKELALLDVIAADPIAELGARTVSELGSSLPFLLKVLSAELPLSIQVHPSKDQAADGYAWEDAKGIPLDSPERNYKDRNHKPELICALTEFEALCGFREVAATARLFENLELAELRPFVESAKLRPSADVLRTTVAAVIAWPRERQEDLVDQVAAACARYLANGGEFEAECSWAVRLHQDNPGDLGVVAALTLNLITLQPGQAMFLPAGVMHAYLHGTGVELMANSDNVLRGGLTPKHVDLLELMRIVNFDAAPVPLVPADDAGPGLVAYRAPVSEFRLWRANPTTGRLLALDTMSPQILLVTEGAVTLRSGQEELLLAQGESAYVRAGEPAVMLDGCATVFRASNGL